MIRSFTCSPINPDMSSVDPTLATTTEHFIEIGKIVAPQGLQGELRVYPSTDFPERFLEPGKRWLLSPGQTEPRPIELLKGHYLDGKGLYVIKLENITDRSQAEALKGCVLMVPKSDRPSLEEDEFLVLDLIGMEVFEQSTQALVGTVVNVFSAGNDVLEVQFCEQWASTTNLKKALIPFVKEIVPVVDVKQRRIEITPPQGLVN